LLTQWLKLLEQYGECWKWEDCAWYHRELSSLSFFAGAVWTLGGLVLQEYSIEKRIDGKATSGRCDLYFGLPEADGSYANFDAEAKHDWYVLDSNTDGNLQGVRQTLEKAASDAKSLPKRPGRVGICFISFCVQNARKRTLKKAERSDVRNSIGNFIAEMHKPSHDWFDSAAWFFSENEDLINCPGVAVFLRRV
jgi:hypothetical protein